MNNTNLDGSLFLLLLAAIYFLPSIVAVYKEHSSAGAVAALNLFLGWSLLGWIIAIVWALSDPTKTIAKKMDTMHRLERGAILRELALLRDQGVLSDEEFTERKREVMENK